MSTTTIMNDRAHKIRLPARKSQDDERKKGAIRQGVWLDPGANEVDEEYLDALMDRDNPDYNPAVLELFDVGYIRPADDKRDRSPTLEHRVPDLPGFLSGISDLGVLEDLWLKDPRKGAKAAIEKRMVEVKESGSSTG